MTLDSTTISKLKACFTTLLTQFPRRFTGMCIDILWVTFLDPRKRQMRHVSRSEYEVAKKKFIDEVMKLIVLSISQEISYDERSDDNDIDPFFGSTTFDYPSTTKYASIQETDPDAMTTANDELHHSSVIREIENYLDPQLHIHFKDDPLVWWRDYRFQFPRIAVGARKWLCVRGTSTPSDRVFSHSGVALTAKRATMRGDALMKQVLLKNNLKHVNLSTEDIKKALL
jgi:hypothetical protein